MAPSPLLAAIVAIYLADWALTLPVLHEPSSLSPPLSRSDLPSAACDHPGNADLYGLGIRLGIYLQILSTIIGMITLPDVLYDFQDSNAILLLAILIALVKNTPGRAIQEIDVIILLRIVWCMIISGFSLMDIKAENKAFFRKDNPFRSVTATFAIIARALIVGFVASYNVWFWFDGPEYLNADGNCQAHLFLFAKINAHGRVRDFYKFTSILLIILYGVIPAVIWFYVAVLVFVFVICFAFVIVLYAIYFPIALPLIYLHLIFVHLKQRHKRWARKGRLIGINTPTPQSATLAGSPATPVTSDSQPARPSLTGRLRKAWSQMGTIGRFIARLIYFRWRDLRERLIRSASDGSESEEIAEMTTAERNAASEGDFTVRDAVNLARRNTTSAPGPTGLNTPATRKMKTARIVYIALISAYFVWSIIGIELTIAWNSVDDMYDIRSTGQLVPFVVGVASFFRIAIRPAVALEEPAFKAMRDWVKRTRKEEFDNEAKDRSKPARVFTAPNVLAPSARPRALGAPPAFSPGMQPFLDTVGLKRPPLPKRRASMSDMKSRDEGVETFDTAKARLRTALS